MHCSFNYYLFYEITQGAAAVVCLSGGEVMLPPTSCEKDAGMEIMAAEPSQPTNICYKCGDCLNLFPGVTALQQHMARVSNLI